MKSTLTGREARFLVGLVALLASLAAPAAARVEAPTVAPAAALVAVSFHGPADLARFTALGLDVLTIRSGVGAHVLAWPGDLEAIAAAGFGIQVLDADYGRTLARERGVAPKADRASTTAVPPFGAGSLAGFYTLAEVNAFLDSIASNDPNGIVSSVVDIGLSRQSRPIRAIRIAKESAGDHTRPRVLYTGLTHAREPGGMQNILYFISKLLQGYGTDPNLTYLVDEREMWFVPLVNPDGYLINQNTWFNSGSFGLWRKNARDNNNDGSITSADGVDINRNFGYQWGFDNIGSSGTPSSATYRGTAGFSEPETRAIRDHAIAHGFRTAQNFHTFHEATLWPFAYNASATPDAAFFTRLVDDMMRDSHYAYGNVVEILYEVNGDANDWMYGEQVAKPKAIAVTSECGGQNDNFWPPASRILPIAHQNLRSNVVLAYGAGTYAHPDPAVAPQIVSEDGFLHPNGSAEIALTLRNDGLDPTNGIVTVTATTAVPGITITDPISTFPALASLAAAGPGSDRIGIEAASSVPSGTVVPLALAIHDTGTFALCDTTWITVGQPVVVFSDDASSGLGSWTPTGGWGTQNLAGDLVFSDSPAGDYAVGADARLTLAAPLDLSGGHAARLEFNTQWKLEGGFDFARVEVSTNGGTTWTALPGRMTRPGHGNTGGYGGGTQPLGVPGYDGTNAFFEPEVIDLTAYVGLTNLRLRFRLTSDAGVEWDGWHVDDVRVLVYPEDTTDAGPEAGEMPGLALAVTGANPFHDTARLRATFARPTAFRAAVYGVDGRRVQWLGAGMAAAGSRDLVWDGRAADGRRVAAGAYVIRLDAGAESVQRRVVLVH